jgi:hypothetical protein
LFVFWGGLSCIFADCRFFGLWALFYHFKLGLQIQQTLINSRFNPLRSLLISQ